MKFLILILALFLTGILNAQFVATNTFSSSTHWEGDMISNRSSGYHYDNNEGNGITHLIYNGCEFDGIDEEYLNGESYFRIGIVEVGGYSFPDIDEDITFFFNHGSDTYELEDYSSSTAWSFYIYDTNRGNNNNTIYSRSLYSDMLEEFIEHGEFEIEITSLEDDEEYEITLQAFPSPHKTKNLSKAVSYCYHLRETHKELISTLSIPAQPTQSDNAVLLYEIDQVIRGIETIKRSPQAKTLLETIKPFLEN